MVPTRSSAHKESDSTLGSRPVAATNGSRGPDVLALRDVVVGYGGGDVLRGVSFSVPKGSITCVIGPNGAGKSTVLAAIVGLLVPRAGEIICRDEVISGMDPRQIIARGVVTVPQAHSLFGDMTVRDNVNLGAYTIRDRSVIESRRRAVETLFPIVVDYAREKASHLSGGQQRLVELARALMLDPDILLLDEPSMGLDPSAQKTVFGAILDMNRSGRTILLVEQNAKAALRLSHQGIVLEGGVVRLSGTGKEVLEHEEIGRLYLGGGTGGEGTRS